MKKNIYAYIRIYILFHVFSIYIYIYISESLCCIPETNYNTVSKLYFNKNKNYNKAKLTYGGEKKSFRTLGKWLNLDKL